MNREALEPLLAAPPFAGLDAEFAFLLERLAAPQQRGDSPTEPHAHVVAPPQDHGSREDSPRRAPDPLHPSSLTLHPSLLVAAALVSRWRREGHVCLDLTAVAGSVVQNDRGDRFLVPPLEDWQRELQAAPSVVGRPGDVTPLVLDGTRLYWRRYWDYEHRLAERLRALVGAPGTPQAPQTVLATRLDTLFPASGGTGHPQREAAEHILGHRLTVLLGGPGTGKTWTVVRAIAAWIATAGSDTRVAVTAPTGKAVARLQESLHQAAQDGGALFTPLDGVARRAQTLHRLLGIRPTGARPRHDAIHPVPADLVVVDEASMVDLALMTKLTEALLPTAHLVLLGDPHQLAAVEAGSVLADLAAGLPPVTGPESARPGPRPSGTLTLRGNHRFGPESGIHRVSEAVNAGNVEDALAVLRRQADTPSGTAALQPLPSDLGAALRRRVLQAWGADAARREPRAALAEAGRFRILAAVRRGPQGVEGINRTVEDLLRAAGWAGAGPWYAGRPVLITANDPEVGLYNGDLGVVLPDDDGRSWVWFRGDKATPRRVAPARLPPHETAYALTVHKSQGSEFDHVLLVLPDRMSPVLTRELIYTGLTRARQSAEIWSPESILRQAIQQRTARSSGLRERLRHRGPLEAHQPPA